MGPLVTGAHRDKVAGYVRRRGGRRRANWWWTGGSAERRRRRDGFWLGPTLFDNVTTGMCIYTDEIFGPVLCVVRVDSYDEGSS